MVTAEPIQTDIAIIGGGVAGLWALNVLRDSGRSAVLFEKDQIGAGQSLASQGMIHGGIKYTLSGATSAASETIGAMPERWRACLAGTGSIDLSGVNVLSDRYYMFSDGRLSSKITAFFGSKAIRARVNPVDGKDVPEAFTHPAFNGLLYQLEDLVLDTGSLLRHLTRRYPSSIHQGNPQLITANGKLTGIELESGQRFVANTYVFAAGAGNGEIIETLGLPVEMQLRPLHQVIVKGENLPDIYAHAVSMKSADKPRITITTHKAGNRKAWYLGGELSESGIDRSEDAQIETAKQELEVLLPWIPISDCEFSTFRVDRAEASQQDAGRPDTPFVKRFGNVVICWPTKLTLVPMLGDILLEDAASHRANEPPNEMATGEPAQPTIACAPWEQASKNRG
jgi:glycerol-3-phosphate dehydrogenase